MDRTSALQRLKQQRQEQNPGVEPKGAPHSGSARTSTMQGAAFEGPSSSSAAGRGSGAGRASAPPGPAARRGGMQQRRADLPAHSAATSHLRTEQYMDEFHEVMNGMERMGALGGPPAAQAASSAAAAASRGGRGVVGSGAGVSSRGPRPRGGLAPSAASRGRPGRTFEAPSVSPYPDTIAAGESAVLAV